MVLSHMITFLIFLTLVSNVNAVVEPLKVSFDGRSFLVNDERKLFISGSIHYPRAPRKEWPNILQMAKDNGINIIQTYVFWDIHEPVNDEWHFPSSPTSSEDLVAFVQEAAKLDLYVHLRIAGYICAEWNFGGMPGWLRTLNSTLRTYDEVWMEQLSQFVEKTISVVRDAGLLAGQGGPIVMLQMENEYGNMESYYGEGGHKYVQWLSEYALSLDVAGVPWVMCQQGEGTGSAPSPEIVNACNGFYCDNWISSHAADFPNQPHMWTENWPGWFQNWGEPIPHRPAVDVAFAVARWFARGGSYMNYYMAFGGSTFGRSVGGPLIVTSYDYDVQINEFGLRAEPKFSLLQQLHLVLQSNAEVLLSHLPPKADAISSQCESHTYMLGERCLAFLSNWGERSTCFFPVQSGGDVRNVSVAPWSVTISSGPNCSVVVYSTKDVESAARTNQKVATAIDSFQLRSLRATPEPVPSQVASVASFAEFESLLGSSALNKISVPTVHSDWPQEQLSLTSDSTDYLWYSTVLSTNYTAPTNVSLQFQSGTAGGGLFYVFVNGVKVASTLGAAGGPPVVASNGAANRRRRGVSGWEPTTQVDKSSVPAGENLVADQVGESFQVSLTVPVPAGSGLQLDILSVSMGLKNYGPFLEAIQVGITSNITVDGDILKGFTHSIGLQGEALQLSSAQSLLSSEADLLSLDSARQHCAGLCWYSARFATPASVSADSHVALDLSSSMGKGAVWVNGHMLGRFWNITATPTAAQQQCDSSLCTSEAYTGSYSGDKCRTGCGEPSQQFYKLPTEWLRPVDSVLPNTLVLFEELGGSPALIQMVEVSMAAL